jgi:putative endonuclease
MSGSENLTDRDFVFVYVLRSSIKDYTYIGYTTRLENRVATHNNKRNQSTKPYAPFDLIHFEAYRNVNDARRREKCLKSSQGSRLLKRMLKKYYYSEKNNQISTS